MAATGAPCQWIQQLPSYGLLQGCFQPLDIICDLRSLVREKAVLVAEQADWLRRMQKCMEQMNVRIQHAVSDIHGTTGMAMLRPGNGIRCSGPNSGIPAAQKAKRPWPKELTGNWRADHLFNLKEFPSESPFVKHLRLARWHRDNRSPAGSPSARGKERRALRGLGRP